MIYWYAIPAALLFFVSACAMLSFLGDYKATLRYIAKYGEHSTWREKPILEFKTNETRNVKRSLFIMLLAPVWFVAIIALPLWGAGVFIGKTIEAVRLVIKEK